ncbi:DUF995 domain-containing protein [Rhodobacteraceae bacterium D3-12]|nr:DUF995 domain-containing protein [Rhodobacteraceae bacterium D3-12]
MTRFSKGMLISAFLVAVPSLGIADPKPRNAQPATAAKITKIYAGKTDVWDTDCGGGIYFGPNGQARAWCATNPDTLGAGTWYATNQGQLCHKLKWYYPQGSGAGVSAEQTSCIDHVDKRWGNTYRNYADSAEWWPIDDYSGPKRGYKFQANVKAARAKLGL